MKHPGVNIGKLARNIKHNWGLWKRSIIQEINERAKEKIIIDRPSVKLNIFSTAHTRFPCFSFSVKF